MATPLGDSPAPRRHESTSIPPMAVKFWGRRDVVVECREHRVEMVWPDKPVIKRGSGIAWTGNRRIVLSGRPLPRLRSSGR